MNKKKRIAVIAIILTLLLCISASVIGILSSSPKTPEKPKEPEIPKITEDFKEIELVSKLTTDGKIYYKVTTFIALTIPLFDVTVKLPMSGETKTMFYDVTGNLNCNQ